MPPCRCTSQLPSLRAPPNAVPCPGHVVVCQNCAACGLSKLWRTGRGAHLNVDAKILRALEVCCVLDGMLLENNLAIEGMRHLPVMMHTLCFQG